MTVTQIRAREEYRLILVTGDTDWPNQAGISLTLDRIERIFKPPYHLLSDGQNGAAQRAYAAAASRGGWTAIIQPTPRECTPDCPPSHKKFQEKRPPGQHGLSFTGYCPGARNRNFRDMILRYRPELVVIFTRREIHRFNTAFLKDLGLAVWTVGRGVKNG